MASLKLLRITIVIFFFIFIFEELMISLYDFSLASPILLQAKTIIEELFKTSLLYNVLSFFALLTLAYSAATLWFGYSSGRWAYILFILLEILIQCLTPTIAFSGITSAINSLYFITLGIILTQIFQPQLQSIFLEKKSFKWRVVGLFLIFIIVCTIPAIVAFNIS